MALVKCPECQAEVSDSAWECNKCGNQLRKPKRTIFGKAVKCFFILFNLIMAWWLVAAMGASIVGINELSEFGQTGASIANALGAIVVFCTWAIGNIVLGAIVLLTRPQKN